MQSSSETSRTAASVARPANRASAALSFAHVSLALAGLMWVYSFLNYYHGYPITTFYQEWGTALLGLAAMTLLAGGDYWRKPEIPRIVLLPVGMMLLVVVQFLLGKMPYLGQMLLFALYFMWAALLVMLGGRLRELLGLPTVATVLAVSLLLGAEANALAGLHQHYQWHFLERVVTLKTSSAVYGNIAQPNHFGDYLVLGLASLGLLYARGALRAWQAALLALPILFVLPLTGSRGTWLYLLWLALSAFMWQRRDRGQRSLLNYSLLVLLGFGLMHLVIHLPWLAVDSGSVNTLQRMVGEDVHSGSIRLYLWHEAGLMFLNSPLLGVGFGEYAWQHYQLGPVLHNTVISSLYNNAHNLVMDFAAEGGLVALLVLGGTLVPWLRRAWGAERSIYHWWGYAVLAVLAIHSMLEYPLWYAYFLGIAALLVGILDTGRFRLELGVTGRALVTLTLVLGAVSLQQLYSGYQHYEGVLARPAGGASSELAAMEKLPLLQPYADLLTTDLIGITPEHLEAKLKLNGDVQRFVPTAAVAYRQSMLLAQKGDMAGAQVEMERAIWSYPGDFAMAEGMLGKLTGKDPDHFRALLEFAVQKHEEYLSAVHTK